MVMESLFVEGRCIHANEGNNDRIAECVMCFNRANPMLMVYFSLYKCDHKSFFRVPIIWKRTCTCI